VGCVVAHSNDFKLFLIGIDLCIPEIYLETSQCMHPPMYSVNLKID